MNARTEPMRSKTPRMRDLRNERSRTHSAKAATMARKRARKAKQSAR